MQMTLAGGQRNAEAANLKNKANNFREANLSAFF
jgi:hypothetical protein